MSGEYWLQRHDFKQAIIVSTAVNSSQKKGSIIHRCLKCAWLALHRSQIGRMSEFFFWNSARKVFNNWRNSFHWWNQHAAHCVIILAYSSPWKLSLYAWMYGLYCFVFIYSAFFIIMFFPFFQTRKIVIEPSTKLK